jgi:hypothetical protein
MTDFDFNHGLICGFVPISKLRRLGEDGLTAFNNFFDDLSRLLLKADFIL